MPPQGSPCRGSDRVLRKSTVSRSSRRDLALEYLVQLPQWAYLKPLLRLRKIWTEARDFGNRHQKVGEKKKDGSFSNSPNRKGPLTLSARTRLLDKILTIQQQVNEVAASNSRPQIDLINREEEARIRELIELKTFPNKWSGTEPIGNEIVPQFDRQGNIQMPLSLW